MIKSARFIPSPVKAILRKTPLFRMWLDFKARQQLLEWKAEGKPIPPPAAYKHATLREYASRFNIKTLIETGTFYGDTVFAFIPSFDCIYSIELDDELYRRATERFAKQPE